MTVKCKWVNGYWGRYKAYSNGDIISFVGKLPRKLKPVLRPDGYYSISIGGRQRGMRLHHRVVAETFLPNPRRLPQVNHKDGNKSNNCTSNLEWVTDQENKIHGWKNGLMKSGFKRGERCNFSKLKEKQVIEIRNRYKAENISSRKLAKEYNVSQFAVLSIVNGKSWTHI